MKERKIKKERAIVERYIYISTANELMQASSQASLKERTNEFMMRKLVMQPDTLTTQTLKTNSQGQDSM